MFIGEKTSLIVQSIKIENDTYEYKYDELYNIIDIFLNKNITNHYKYDNFNQLIEDDNYVTNIKYKYSYDKEGNILKKEEYDPDTDTLIKTDTFEYTNSEWEDQLTKYNDEAITYDAIGNPLTIGSKTLTWKNGRQLHSYSDSNANMTIFYEYNADGIRTSKYGYGESTNYFLEGSDIVLETRGTDMLYYIRNNTGALIGFKYNGEPYYYIKNLQEDIIGLKDSNFDTIATYTYDAWGKLLSIKDATGVEITDENHIAHINPFRYRNYYYDKETGLYYLKSRYYNPEWGRFLNVDGYILDKKLNINMYLYCKNNPVTNIDTFGKSWNTVLQTFLSEVKIAIEGLAPAYAGAGGIAASDGFFPYGDVVATVIAGTLTLGAIAYGISQVIPSKTIEQSESTMITSCPPINNHQEYFPKNPNTFHPKGLVKQYYKGTYNGAIIRWSNPLNQKVIFEWDEDIRNGSHYHVGGIGWDTLHNGTHYYPGTPVSEPWNTIYFGG